MRALCELEGVQVSVISVPLTNEAGMSEIDGLAYRKLRMSTRALSVLPRAIRYFLEMVEFTIKVVIAGRRVRPGIVHSHDTFALPAGWILKKMLGCQLVYDAHELESNKNAQNVILSNATLLIEKFCWPRVDLLVSVSDLIIEWYMQHLGFKPSVLVLNSPAIAHDIDAGFDSHDHGTYFHEKYAIPAGHLVFVYLGILGSGRGIETCLEAFALGPKNAHGVFIGFGPLQRIIEGYAERHPNIHFHHAVSHEQVVSLVRHADYGLCLVENASLSDFYCLPNKLFEYCFARLPVLASRFPEISRLVEKYSLGVCCDPDVASVRAALSDLIGRRPARPNSDITELSWEAQAQRLRSAYRDQLLAPAGER